MDTYQQNGSASCSSSSSGSLHVSSASISAQNCHNSELTTFAELSDPCSSGSAFAALVAPPDYMFGWCCRGDWLGRKIIVQS